MEENMDEAAANRYAEECNGGSRGSGIIQQSFLAGIRYARQQADLSGVTHIKILDEGEQIYVNWDVQNVQVSLRDEGKTLEVIIDSQDKASAPVEKQDTYSKEDMLEAFKHGLDIEAGTTQVCFDQWVTNYNRQV